MSTATLTSLAILKANWDQNQRDYIENFVPFVAHILAENTGSPISLADLQRSMQDSFGLNVPQNSLKTILGRARRRDYVKKEGDAYFPVKEKLQNLRFQQVRERALREHQAIVNKLRNFSKTRYNMAWTTEDAEGARLRYLAGYDVEVLVASIEGAPILPAGRSPKSGKFIVNAFVRELSEEDPEGFGYLETVVKGHMLANALLFPEPANVVRKFQKTDFYLDTTFVLRLLGTSWYS
jgi:hypothetical protein